jgi:tetratricopeptide (TPR) repeat protein
MELTQDSYEARELQWQLYTKAGNQLMQASLYSEAQQAYHQALALADSLLEEAKVSSQHTDAIHPYVVSCHNLADSWLNLANVPQAEKVLLQAFDQVVEVMNHTCLSSSLRLEAFKALKAVSFEIDGFYRKLDQVAQAEEIFERAIALSQVFLAQLDSS